MNHDCENCNHYNFLIHHEAGVFYQCFLGNKLWEDCNDFDAVKEVSMITENKRFKYYEHKGADYILENPNEDLDFIEMLGDCLEAEEIVNRLNELYDEKEQLKNENKLLRIELDTHKHPLWSTREAERILKEKEGKIIELVDLLANEVLKNSNLLSENNDLRKKLMICEKRAKR